MGGSFLLTSGLNVPSGCRPYRTTFYPDFVAELTDVRVLVVEYKGEPYKTNDDSKEKAQVGFQWEQSSNSRCLFLFAVEADDDGRDVFKQLHDKLAD